MKKINFFEKLWEHSRTLRRVGLVLVMCLIAIPQMWAGVDGNKTIFLDLSNCSWYMNDGYYPKIEVLKGDNTYYKHGHDEQIGDHIFRFEVDASAKAIQFFRVKGESEMNHSGFMYIDKDNYDGDNVCCYKYYNYYIKSSDGNGFANDVNGRKTLNSTGGEGYFYAGNLTTTNYVSLLMGRWDNSKAATMSLVNNTEKLYYSNSLAYNIHAWTAIVGTTSAWTDANEGASRLDYASDRTYQKYGYQFLNGSKYYMTKDGTDPGTGLNIEYKANYSDIPTFTTTLNVKVKEGGAGSYSNGSTSNKPATTISLQGTILSSGGTSGSSRSSVTWTDGSSCSYNSVISGAVTTSYSSLGSTWNFDGWYINDEQVGTGTSYDFYQHSNTTVEARFTKKYTVTYSNRGAHASHNTVPAPATQYLSGATVTVKDNTELMWCATDGKVFAGWATTTDKADAGTVDYDPCGATKTFTITSDVTLYPVWKNGSYLFNLVGSSTNGTLNRTDFILRNAQTNTATEVNGVTFSQSYFTTSANQTNCLVGQTQDDKVIIYDAKTTNDKVKIYVKNIHGSTAAVVQYVVIKDGVTANTSDTVKVNLPAGTKKVISVDMASSYGARLVICTSQYSYTAFTQIIAIQNGTTLHSPCTAGYQLSFPGRPGTVKNTPYTIDGITLYTGADMKFGTGSMKVSTAGTEYIQFATTATAVQLQVTAGTNKHFYVCTDKSKASTTGYYLGGTKDATFSVNLQPSTTYYITGGGDGDCEISKIAFASCAAFTATRGGQASGTYTIDSYDGSELTCTPSVEGFYTYQWKQNTSNSKAGAVNAVGDGNTTASFTPDPASAGTYYYYCVVTDGCSNSQETTLSGAFTFEEGCSAPTSPSISGTTSYEAGDDIELTASATGTDGSTTYQWYKGDPKNGGVSQGDASTSGATFSKASCVTGDAGTYYCVISNGEDCDVTTYQAITVSCLTAPSAVTSLNNSAHTATSLTYTWTKASNASGYTATLYSDADCTVSVEAKALGDVATATFTGLTPSTTYYCKVQSKGNGTVYCVDGGTTSKVSGATDAPSAPTFSPTSGSTVSGSQTITMTGHSGSTVFYAWATSAQDADDIYNSGSGSQGTADAGTASVTVQSGKTLYAISRLSGVNSAISSASYTIDDTAPTLSSSTPADDATDVNTSGTIVLTFSEALGSVDGTKFTLTNATMGAVAIDGSDNTKVNIAYSGASYSTTVTLATAAGAVADAVGNTSAALSSISFTTKAAPTYYLVTSTAQLNTSDTYVIMEAAGAALMGTWSGSDAYSAAVTSGFTAAADKSTVTVSSSDVNTLTLQAESSAWNIIERTGTNKVTTNSTVSANLYCNTAKATSDSKDDFVFEFGSGKATIKRNTTTDYHIYYTSGTPNKFNQSTSASNIRLYTSNSTPVYTITYNLNGGSGTLPTNRPEYSGTSITLASSDGLTKDGYTFDGWLCSANSTKYAAEASYTMTATNTTFTAQWVSSGYAITTGDHDGGTIAITDDEDNEITSAEEGDEVYLTATPNTGYEFSGWTVLNESEERVSVTQSWKPSAHFTMPDEPVTVSAEFAQVNYAIMPKSVMHFRYTVQVGEAEAVDGYARAHYGDVITLAQSSIADGYHLKTWGVTKTESGDEVTMESANTFVMPAEDVTINPIVGKWYTVTFDANTGDEEDNPDPITQTAVDGAITMPEAPTKSGYTFVNWMIGGTTIAAGGSYTPPTDVTAYATWKADCAGGGGDPAWYYYFTKSADATTNGVTNASTIFTSVPASTGDASSALSFSIGGLTLSSAKWGYKGQMSNGDELTTMVIPSGYTLTNLQIAVNPGGSNLVIKVYNNAATPEEVASSGTIANNNGEIATIDDDLSAGTYHIKFTGRDCSRTYALAAQLTPGSSCYYVTYDGNGAAGGYTNDPEAYSSGEDVTVLANSFTHPGYSFSGWNTEADGTGDPYSAGGTIEDIAANTTLYAQWTPATLYFTRAVDGDWTDPLNWKVSGGDPGCIPTIEHDVVIQGNVTLYGPYAEDRKGHGVAKSVRINNGYSLDIWTEGGLIIAEDIKAQHAVDGAYEATTPDDLSIETTILGNGTLITGGASSTTQALYKFRTKAFTCYVTEDGKRRKYYYNQYCGIPFQPIDPMTSYYGCTIYEYGAATDSWITPTTEYLQPFVAYNLLRKNAEDGDDIWLRGTLNLPGKTGEVTLECGWRGDDTGTTIDGNKEYQDYMFANSWTAPIDISSLDEEDCSDNLVQSIYMFNTGYEREKGVKEIGNKDGQWSVFPFKAGKYMKDAVIPGTQAFLVTAKSSGATLTLKYGKHVYYPALEAGGANNFPTRAPKRAKHEEITPNKLMITVLSDNIILDNMYIFEREDFTEDFDNGWDGTKIIGSTRAPQLYARQGNNKMEVTAVPEMEGLEIGFIAGTDTNSYAFEFEYLESEPLYLYDRETMEYTLIENKGTYSFSTEDNLDHARFVLTRSKSPQIATGVEPTNDKVVDTKVRKVLINNHIYIIRGGNMYSIDGALVK